MFYFQWHDFAVVGVTLAAAFGMAWGVWRRFAEVPSRSEVLTLYAAAACGIFIVPSLALIQFTSFHAIRWFYHTGAVVPAIVGVVLAVALARRELAPRASWVAAAATAFFVSFTPLAIYMTFIAPYQLVIERAQVSVPAERAGSETLRVVVLADVQTRGISEWEERVLEEVRGLRPDLILIPGDVLQLPHGVYQENMGPMKQWLSKLEAPGGVWMVSGDVDADAELLAQGTGVHFIDGETTMVRVRDREVTLGGISIDYEGAVARRVIGELEGADGGGDIRLLLSHRPAAVESFPTRDPSRVDLVVAGHTHGGQIVVPGFGPPITFSPLDRHVAAGGLHTVGPRRVYVSRGVGLERGGAPQLRFNCPPEVTLLEIGD